MSEQDSENTLDKAKLAKALEEVAAGDDIGLGFFDLMMDVMRGKFRKKECLMKFYGGESEVECD